MVELEFSVMENNPGDIVHLRPLLKIFEEEHHIRVHPVGITWAQGWTEIAKFGIYRNGPDVSAIGTTWIGLWGAVEDKLRVGLSNIWADLFDNPTQDLDECIEKHLSPLARQLNMTLGN